MTSIDNERILNPESIEAADVWLADTRVGLLSRRTDGRLSFRFDDSYRGKRERPVLGQKFEDDLARTYVGRIPGRLPFWFANLVAEGKLRSIQVRTFGIQDEDELTLLATLGDDLPGAVRVSPTTNPAPDDNNSVDSAEPTELPQSKTGYKFSLAGVQLKFSMLRSDDRFALAARNQLGEWIVKVGTHDFPGLACNEHTMMRWAHSVGFEVPTTLVLTPSAVPSLAEFVDAKAELLAVERFDRVGATRRHQEDFAQVFGWLPSRKYDSTYEQLFAIALAIVGPDSWPELLKRLVFIVACGNNDAHLKNWGLVYPDGIAARLAPLYDQVATVAWERPDRKLALKLCGAKDFGLIDRDKIRRLAGKLGQPEKQAVEIATDLLHRLHSSWPTICGDTGLSGTHREEIEKHWRAVPLLREQGSLS